ncbi:Mitochondrial beta-keto-acyl synthase [Schaereria dolodes]|nr:Mitochondrial beta-keto-acyl synthase [Schaereria dolodes]
MRKVAITGLGAVTPLGLGVCHSWKRLIDGECGIKSLNESGPTFQRLQCQVAGLVPRGGKDEGSWSASDWLNRDDERRMTKFMQYAVVAAKEALDDAGWCPESLEEQEMTGPNHAVSTACTTGAHSIGDAARFIAFGDADVMVAGGAESCIHPLAITGFERSRSLTTSSNDVPARASRPFNRDRDGFVVGEGAGVMVLEELTHALARNRPIYALLSGYAATSDAHHLTQPPLSGHGAMRAMSKALKHAQLPPSAVDYINAHATSTVLGDAAENRAIRSVMLGLEGKERASDVCVSSTKGSLGHLLGAAGAVEGIFSVMAIKENIVPPTLNLTHIDGQEFDMNYVPLVAQERQVDVVLSNSFGFGGTNASLCFTRYNGNT